MAAVESEVEDAESLPPSTLVRLILYPKADNWSTSNLSPRNEGEETNNRELISDN